MSEPTPAKAESKTNSVGVAAWERPRSLLLMAVWFGLLTGAIEAVFLLALYLSHRVVLDFVSPIIWTIPLANAAVFALPGLGFFFWARRRGVSPRLRKIALFCFCTVALSVIAFSICSV